MFIPMHGEEKSGVSVGEFTSGARGSLRFIQKTGRDENILSVKIL
jgi:hypothetical protein